MGNGKSVLLIGLILLVFACGCAKPVYQLPQSWPIPQLTLPAGSVIVTRPVKLYAEHWSVSFDTSDSPAVVAAYVEACLKPLNYKEYWSVHPRLGDSRDLMGKIYYSPDGSIEVMLSLGLGSGTKYGSDYSLTIETSNTPHRQFMSAGTTGENGLKHFLEPIK